MRDAEKLLWKWLREGWKYRDIRSRPRKEREWYHEHIMTEMDMFIQKDVVDYLLFMSDAMRWAKDEGIVCGPGRGSSAASVCVWLLRITEIDPITHPGLLFERFLDPTRTDMPDIDVDIDDERRDEVKAYLASKYGPECVGSIANFVRYRAKNALQDVARVYRIPIAAVEPAKARMIERSGGDSRFDATIEDTIEMFPDAKAVFDAYPDLWKASRLEGNVRGMSVHAAGMVVANSPLTDICAVYERDGVRTLSIDKWDTEYCGALKADFLGLTTMGTIRLCLEMTGLTLEDLYAIPSDDPQTLDIFRTNDVMGIFQFEGRATRLVNRDVIPDNFLEVVDVNALSRPGPLFSGTTAEYCDVKHGRREPERFHPLVDELTAGTKGQIIYQEQILRIVREIGGFDWTHTVEIRRIISKRWGQQSFHVNMQRFQEGAERIHGLTFEQSERIWKRIVTAGTYAFVVAHSVSYATVSWWTAYFKAHHPEVFYAASLAKSTYDDHRFRLMKDAQKHGLRIWPPDLVSGERWSLEAEGKQTGVRAGFTSIPGVGDKMAARIVADRAENGPFNSWYDMDRIHGIGVKKIESMLEFSVRDDPFGLERAGRLIGRVTSAIRSGDLPCPLPTHDGTQVAALGESANRAANRRGVSARLRKGQKVIWVGIVKERLYQEYAENIRSRTGEDMEKILAEMKRPDLQHYCVLHGYDDTDEEVYLRVNRYAFPKFKRKIESIRLERDVVVAVGRKTPGFGTSIALDELYVIEPD